MSELNEDSLDRHFASQLQMVSDVFIRSICPSHHDIIHCWLMVFYKAPTADKYARNCLMVLMHSQLKSMGELGKPFTDLSNTKLTLEEVLSMYESDAVCETGMQTQKLEQTVGETHSDSETNFTSYGDDSNRSCSERKSSCNFSPDKSDYELQSEKNQQLLEEVKILHARTVQNEQQYKKSDSHWQKKLQLHCNQSLLHKVDRSSRQAIRRLKDWSPHGGPLNFMLHSLLNILGDEPDTRRVLLDLDQKLESELENMLELAGERREKNVRILYDQLFKQQQDLLQAKQALLQQEQQALAEARQQLLAQQQTHFYQEKVTQTKTISEPTKSNTCNCANCQELLSPSISCSSLLVHTHSKKELKSKHKI